ncbi:MAG: AMP-binding protein [Vulcanimicrobiota bacterium]
MLRATQSIIARLELNARARSEGIAYTEINGKGLASGSLTHQELLQRVRSRAAYLFRHGLTHQRVVLALPSGLEFVVTFYACLYAGAIPVMIEPLRRPRSFRHLQAVISDCSPRLLVSESFHEVGLECFAPSELELERNDAVEPTVEELAYLQYTSGSTGSPRGVMVTHANILANNRVIQQVCEQPEGATLVSWLPVYHDMGLVSKVLQATYLGGHCILMNPSTFLWKPSLWLKAISDFRAHTTGAPNFGYELALRKISEEDCRSLDLSCLKTAFCAAEPVRLKTLQDFSKRFAPYGFRPEALKPAYGLAEFTLCATLAGPDRKRSHIRVVREALNEGSVVESPEGLPYVNCGTPAPCTSITILSVNDGQSLPENRVGEIALDGPSRTTGHWGDSPSPAPLRTGDLGFLHQGELYVVGRKKDLIILDGRNVHPEDIELTVEAADPRIGPGASVAFAGDDGTRETLMVALELRRGDKAAIEQAVREAVGRDHDLGIQCIFFVNPGELPRTSSGKVRRGACTEMFCSREAEGSAAPIADPLERFLCERLAVLSGRRMVAPETPFEQLGISSVQRFSLMSELAEVLGIPVAGDATWTYPSPRELLANLSGGQDDTLRVLNQGTSDPLVLVPSIGGDINWAQDLLNFFPEELTVIELRQPRDAFPTLEQLAESMVEALLKQCPRGPFSLVGYSLYSRLAYEVARQLKFRGLEIKLVVAIDGTVYNWRRLSLLEFWRQFWTYILGHTIQVIRRRGISGLLSGMRGAWRNLLDFLFLRGVPIPEFLRAVPEPGNSPNQEILDLNLRLGNAYRPKPMEGNILVFRTPPNNFSGILLRDAGWGEVALGKIEIVDLQGTHSSILKSPTAEVIARTILERHLGAELKRLGTRVSMC